MNELRLESLAADRVPSTGPALLVADTINGQAASLDEQDSFTMTGTATWNAGSGSCFSFVATGPLPGADAIRSTAGQSITARYIGDADFTMATSQVLRRMSSRP